MAISHRLICKTIALWPFVAALSTPDRGIDQDRNSLRESGKRWAGFRHVLEALPLYIPTNSTWERMEEWIGKAITEGERFGMAVLRVAGWKATVILI